MFVPISSLYLFLPVCYGRNWRGQVVDVFWQFHELHNAPLQWRQWGDLNPDLSMVLDAVERDALEHIEKSLRCGTAGLPARIARIQTREALLVVAKQAPSHNELNQGDETQGDHRQQHKSYDPCVTLDKHRTEGKDTPFESRESALWLPLSPVVLDSCGEAQRGRLCIGCILVATPQASRSALWRSGHA